MTSARTSGNRTPDGAEGNGADGGSDGRSDGDVQVRIKDVTAADAAQAVGGAAAAGATEYTVIVALRGDGEDREFLMVQHRDRGWELPGGKVEAGEGPVHCALREFREETGHILAGPRFVEKMATGNGTCYVFTGGLGERVGAVHDNEVVLALRWCTRLPPEGKLAFPDDPYDEIGARLGIRFR